MGLAKSSKFASCRRKATIYVLGVIDETLDEAESDIWLSTHKFEFPKSSRDGEGVSFSSVEAGGADRCVADFCKSMN